LRLVEDIDQKTFARKHTEMRDQLASIKVQADMMHCSQNESGRQDTVRTFSGRRPALGSPVAGDFPWNVNQ